MQPSYRNHVDDVAVLVVHYLLLVQEMVSHLNNLLLINSNRFLVFLKRLLFEQFGIRFGSVVDQHVDSEILLR